MSTFQAPKGVPEYLPPESGRFGYVRWALAEQARLAGYGYIELPVFEHTEVFTRAVGESTDVVSKEMYVFEDRGGRSLALRPEGTAGVMRSVIEHGVVRGPLPAKLWYAGPFFRAERPQKGRYRQLQQVGIEAIGSDDPLLDAEVIALADAGFRSLGLRQFTLMLTSLGCSQCRPAYRELLSQFLAGCDLDEETRQRAELNPLRVLDDKRPQVQDQLADAPLMINHLCDSCQHHHEQVVAFLDAFGVPWQPAPRLVRGLDYYTRTTFEFDHPLLGAQSGIGGGGRYDGLVASLGGPELSGIGWGIGVDRTLLACEAEGIELPVPQLDLYLIALDAQARLPLARIAGECRAAGKSVDISFGSRGLKGAMKAANRSGAKYVGIIGSDELAMEAIQIKDMDSGEQSQVRWTDIVAEVR